MKRNLFTFSIISFSVIGVALLFSFRSATLKLDEAYDPCEINNWTFGTGEEIVYKIYYNWNFVWLSAGEVVFKIEDEGTQYHLSARGKTYSTYEWFFKAKDSYDSYIDKKTLLPTMSIRDVHEGKYRLYEKAFFDQNGNKVVSYWGDDAKNTKKGEFGLPGCMHDILSIVYYTRNFEFEKFKKGEQFPVKIFMDREVWPLNVKYEGRFKNLTVRDFGTFNAFKFTPEVISGQVFKEGTKMDIWVSDDNNRIPVFIESPVSVGSIKVVLKSIKGLRYPLTSRTS
ncbi:MAG TPA: DUF3108 domain-containing protein [Saprospiraceae bacterium]|nr:DUF3108 domain-containing protein [Saprospiraceae bacterium]